MAVSRTKTILTTGFSFIVVLMVTLTVVSVLAHRNSLKRIELIVNTNNIKTHFLTTMRTLARERTVSMQKMLILTDPFERDDEWIRFKSYAGEFIAVRQQLLSTSLSSEERQLLNNLSQLIKQTSGLQNHISELILEGDFEQARKLIIQSAMPGQDRIFEHMSKMLRHLKDEADQAVTEAKKQFQNTVTMLVIIAVFATIGSILVSILLVRRTSNIERQLYREKERAQITLYSIGDGAITTDANGIIEHMNSVAESLTGWSMGQCVGYPLKKVFCLMASSSQLDVRQILDLVFIKRKVATACEETVLVNRQGDEIAIEYSLAPIFNANQDVSGAILIFKDVSEMRVMSRQLAYYAQHDSLTGLLNRREFEVRLQEALDELPRCPETTYWLCYIDLDQFKVVNDTCGHLAGDELLKKVSQLLLNEMKAGDDIARLGGDEFAILLKQYDEKEVVYLLDRVRKDLQDSGFCWGDKCFRVTASIGLVPVGIDSGDMYNVMSQVDTACYVAKDEGRNRIHVIGIDDEASISRKLEMDWVHRIRSALDDDRLELYFQPIKNLHSDEMKCHVEILVRMRRTDGKLTPPNAFIPAAERYNLMSLVDRCVVEKTLEFLQTASLEAPVISINLSAQSLCDSEFMVFLIDKIEQLQIDPSWLCFEITETSAISKLSDAKRFITEMKSIGCLFALDDFGSGLSSFAYLKNLAIDFLKIDGTFIQNIHKDPTDQAMVSSIHQVGHVMGLQTIAEYVENEAIESTLKSIGIDYAQGHWIEEPAPLHEMLNRSFWLPASLRQVKRA